MVLNQSNLMYLPARKVIAAGTNRNIMNAGVQHEKTYLERLDNLIQKTNNLLARYEQQQGLVQAGTTEQKNIKPASAIPSDRQVLDTFIAFTNGNRTGGYTPPCIASLSDSPQQSNLKQASTKKVNAEEMQRTFMEFGGLL